jgi:hypothetical protein
MVKLLYMTDNLTTNNVDIADYLVIPIDLLEIIGSTGERWTN